MSENMSAKDALSKAEQEESKSHLLAHMHRQAVLELGAAWGAPEVKALEKLGEEGEAHRELYAAVEKRKAAQAAVDQAALAFGTARLRADRNWAFAIGLAAREWALALMKEQAAWQRSQTPNTVPAQETSATGEEDAAAVLARAEQRFEGTVDSWSFAELRAHKIRLFLDQLVKRWDQLMGDRKKLEEDSAVPFNHRQRGTPERAALTALRFRSGAAQD